MDPAATSNSAIILTALSFLIIVFRIFLRRLKHEKLSYDDWIMLGAVAFYITLTATYPIVAWNGINVAQTKPEDLKDDAVARIELGSKLMIVQRVMFVSYLWCLKACILIHYTRLAIGTNEMLSVKILSSILGVTWITCMLAFFIGCRPVSDYWRVLPSAPDCAKAVDETVLLDAADALTNIFLMAIPVPLILRTKLSRIHHSQLLATYLGGLSLIMISTLGIVVVLDNLSSVNMYVGAQVHCFIATIVVNALVINDLWRHGWGHIRKGSFKKDSCVPEYSLNILAPTGTPNTRHPTEAANVGHSSGVSRTGSRRQSISSAASRASRESRVSQESEGEQETEVTPMRENKARLAIRKSIRRFSNRLRRSLEQLEIETKIVLVQRSVTGELTPTPVDERREGFFASSSAGRHTARIRTEVSCGSDGKMPPQGQRGLVSKMYKSGDDSG